MSKINTEENQTKNLLLQKIVDGGIIVLISVTVLIFYESYWTSAHSLKENMFALHFDMFSTYYSFAFILFLFLGPTFFEFIAGGKILYRYTDKKCMPTKLARILKIIVVSFFIILFSVIFTDKYSRLEFYNNGNIIIYNRQNQVVNTYTESDIELIELRTNHNIGRKVSYWTEAIIHVKDNKFILKTENYITSDNYEVNYDTARSLYGLSSIKENFPDKIKIDTENIDTLLEVEHYNYTQGQAKKLCEIFEVDYGKMMIWLKEEYDIVLDNSDI